MLWTDLVGFEFVVLYWCFCGFGLFGLFAGFGVLMMIWCLVIWCLVICVDVFCLCLFFAGLLGWLGSG